MTVSPSVLNNKIRHGMVIIFTKQCYCPYVGTEENRDNIGQDIRHIVAVLGSN